MATLVFIDGRREEISYNQACGVKAVKEGATQISGKPVTDRQKAFAASVSEVLFEPLHKQRTVSLKGDPKLKELLHDPKLKGKAKFDAIRQHLKNK